MTTPSWGSCAEFPAALEQWEAVAVEIASEKSWNCVALYHNIEKAKITKIV